MCVLLARTRSHRTAPPSLGWAAWTRMPRTRDSSGHAYHACVRACIIHASRAGGTPSSSQPPTHPPQLTPAQAPAWPGAPLRPAGRPRIGLGTRWLCGCCSEQLAAAAACRPAAHAWVRRCAVRAWCPRTFSGLILPCGYFPRLDTTKSLPPALEPAEAQSSHQFCHPSCCCMKDHRTPVFTCRSRP